MLVILTVGVGYGEVISTNLFRGNSIYGLAHVFMYMVRCLQAYISYTAFIISKLLYYFVASIANYAVKIAHHCIFGVVICYIRTSCAIFQGYLNYQYVMIPNFAVIVVALCPFQASDLEVSVQEILPHYQCMFEYSHAFAEVHYTLTNSVSVNVTDFLHG